MWHRPSAPTWCSSLFELFGWPIVVTASPLLQLPHAPFVLALRKGGRNHRDVVTGQLEALSGGADHDQPLATSSNTMILRHGKSVFSSN